MMAIYILYLSTWIAEVYVSEAISTACKQVAPPHPHPVSQTPASNPIPINHMGVCLKNLVRDLERPLRGSSISDNMKITITDRWFLGQVPSVPFLYATGTELCEK